MQDSVTVLHRESNRLAANSYTRIDPRIAYEGECHIEGGDKDDVSIERKTVGSCSILHVKTKKPLAFNRSWHHIRSDAIDVVTLWFVKQGGLKIHHGGKATIARAGDFAITKSMSPCLIERSLDSQSTHESVNVLIPAHVFRKFISGDIANGFTIAAEGGLFATVERILADIFPNHEKMSERTENLLLESALSVLSDTIQEHKGLTKQKESVSEKRLKTALNFIDVHLSDPKLSNVRVAEACGISPRYLSFLLNKQGLSFADYVKEKRLEVASRWLSSSSPSEITIAEIAFRVGFKSPAHFSRIFKQAYEKGPREYRSECIAVKHYSSSSFVSEPNSLAS
ncbi:helix-turn-helix domain-containing protein [Pseudomaricurvus sp.]|uniref:helix-turn-helix domain-containing protein n=1 Tax=Pseudomaricurvus sp. TaxID=2004510 RepID=UPI003F6C0C56